MRSNFSTCLFPIRFIFGTTLMRKTEICVDILYLNKNHQLQNGLNLLLFHNKSVSLLSIHLRPMQYNVNHSVLIIS